MSEMCAQLLQCRHGVVEWACHSETTVAISSMLWIVQMNVMQWGRTEIHSTLG